MRRLQRFVRIFVLECSELLINLLRVETGSLLAPRELHRGRKDQFFCTQMLAFYCSGSFCLEGFLF